MHFYVYKQSYYLFFKKKKKEHYIFYVGLLANQLKLTTCNVKHWTSG